MSDSSTFYDEKDAFEYLQSKAGPSENVEVEKNKPKIKKARPGQFENRQELYKAIWNGEVSATTSGLTKEGLMKNPKGKIVSKKKYEAGLRAAGNLKKYPKKPFAATPAPKTSQKGNLKKTRYSSQMGSRDEYDNYFKFQSSFFEKFKNDFLGDHAAKREAARVTWYHIAGLEAPEKKKRNKKPLQKDKETKIRANAQAPTTKASYYDSFEIFQKAFEKFHKHKYTDLFEMVAATVEAWKQLPEK